VCGDCGILVEAAAEYGPQPRAAALKATGTNGAGSALGAGVAAAASTAQNALRGTQRRHTRGGPRALFRPAIRCALGFDTSTACRAADRAR